MSKKYLYSYLIILSLFVIAFFVWTKVSATSQNQLLVYFLNVGQGDAIFIETPGGFQILIDSGPNKSVLRELGSIMDFTDKSIDMIVLTHPDKDHIGGFPSVLERYEVDFIVRTEASSDSAVFEEVLEKIEGEGAQEIFAKAGMEFVFPEKISLEILFPFEGILSGDSNASSIVSRLVYGNTEFMLTGDAPKGVEEILINSNVDLESDVLKVGHHGSKTSTTIEFIEEVNPKYAIISAGEENSYGHPHKEVLDNLEGIEILETKDGRIRFVSDGFNLD